ncbi:AMP-binding protein [Spartinivicinus ruber]|uniref:AMP-binding protein n=1 Tax=Spartinivicinus ruber TaxID=2683272 RepID=UPI0013D2406C|nr:AMP-binding protein [Spartinivicinus ruber]
MLKYFSSDLVIENAWQPACFSQLATDRANLKQHLGYLSEDQPVTTAELIKTVSVYANELNSKKSCRGWAIYCEDSICFIVALLAALKTGLEIVIIPNKQPATLNKLINLQYTLLTDSVLDVDSDSYIPVIFDNLLATHDTPDLSDDLEFYLEEWQSFLVDSHQPLYFYTSGTTGKPKLVSKKFGQLVEEVAVLNRLWQENTARAVFISTVSHQHIYGFLFKILWPLTIGNPILSRLISYPEELLAVSQHFAKVVWITSPALLKRLPDTVDGEVKSLSMVVSSGGRLDYPVAKQVADELQQFPIEVLGSTETGGVAWRQQCQQDSAWTPLPRCNVTKDIETGCLQVSSPFISSEHAYLVMGDIIDLQDNGQFLLRERADRIVKVEEKRLSLAQLESVLQQCVEVSQVAAVGLLSGARAKVGVAIVLTEAGQEKLNQLGKRQLSVHFTQLLSNYFERTLLPKKWRYVNQLPENSQGKVSASALAALFEKV